ncbi:ATP-dependent Clp protease ATP-binding subunit CLPT2, chloroplastic [Glycine soja]|uniref:ATP-dependent Clp protease ATP-binding subunit CLPT2, chloroplastic n=1 Tax=Glycine soja TaxID=3848 RepID=A0A445HW85_GLYSO|nr:ATP-dependent Clp protease ATP-binding subunit CLPT2, chloroplastic [Glycine soja]
MRCVQVKNMIMRDGTNLASKFLRAHGITLLKVHDETKLLGKADLFFFSTEHPPLTDEAQRALDQKIKYGWLLSFFSFTIVYHQLKRSGRLIAKLT